MGEVVEAISQEVRRAGFVPRELRSSNEPERSLFTAVRRAYGMRSDDADVCYWNWRSLRTQLREVWSALDAEASARCGRPIQAHVWTFSRERDEPEVLDLLHAVDRHLADLPLLSAVRRPDAAGMMASDKPRGAISSTLGVLHVAMDLPLPQVIIRVLDGLDSTSSNEALLDRLDELAARAGCVPGEPDPSELPKLLCRYYGDGLEERRWTYTEFLGHVHQHSWAGQTDDSLLEWLRSKSPEPVRRQHPTRRTPRAASAAAPPHRV